MEELRYRFCDVYGKTIPADERMHAFARRYAARWFKKHGHFPAGDHPFPNYWDTRFIIEFPELSERRRRAASEPGNPV